MALPERQNPNRPPTHVDDLGDQRVVERTTRSGWRWWWVLPVIVALAFWWAGWGWGGTGGWWWGGNYPQNTAVQAPPGSRTTETLANAGATQPLPHSVGASKQPMSGPGVEILNAQDKKPYVGKEFAANDIPVQQKDGNKAVWVGEKQTMLAVFAGAGNNAANGITHGKIVDVLGTVEKAPSAARAKREWNLTDEQATRLENEGAYIQVQQVTFPQQ